MKKYIKPQLKVRIVNYTSMIASTVVYNIIIDPNEEGPFNAKSSEYFSTVWEDPTCEEDEEED